jgi:hypothetical protein
MLAFIDLRKERLIEEKANFVRILLVLYRRRNAQSGFRDLLTEFFPSS